MDQELKVDQNKLAILVIGMAGTGKTTFVKQLHKQLESLNRKHYIVNLDPAVYQLPYEADTDIRKEINYKELMTKNNLGPNGAIMTALNLYCLQLNTLLDKIETLPKDNEIIIVDTPGQIEAFTWSASGNIIAQTFSASMPTIIAYVIDIARCQNPNSLMSNLLFCCSIFYKMKLPLIVVFNKCDVADAIKPIEWMQDYEKFQEALNTRGTYLSTLNKQMALTLEEFYENFNVQIKFELYYKIAQISALTGQGFEKLLGMIEIAKKEYFEVTLPDIQKNINSRNKIQAEAGLLELQKMQAQLGKKDSQKTQDFNVQLLNSGN